MIEGAPLLFPRGRRYARTRCAVATAEVDYLVQYRNKVLPIEVKAGVKGSMKSLGILMPEKNIDLAVRTSEENLGSVPPGKIKIIPHYLISDFNRVLGSSPDSDLA